MKRLLVLSLTLVFALLAAACSPGELLETQSPGEMPDTGLSTDVPAPTEPLMPTPAIETEDLVATEPVATLEPELVTPESTEEIITVEPPVEDDGDVGVDEPTDDVFLPQLSSEQLANLTIQTPDGQQLGQVIDFVLNSETLNIDYVIASLASTGETVAIPWQALAQITPEEAETALADLSLDLGIDPAVLEQAPPVDLANLDLSSAGWDSELRSFWEPLITSELGQSLPQTGAEVQHLTLQALESARIVAEEAGLGELGSVEEVIVDPTTGQVTYVVVRAGEALGIGEQLIPVPVEALRLAAQEQLSNVSPELILDIQTLLNAPRFEEGQLPEDLQDLNLDDYWNSLP